MICKRSRRNRRGFCNFFLLRRVPRHDDAIAHYPSRSGLPILAIWIGWPKLRRALPCACIFLFTAVAEGQIQVDVKFKRLQYIAYEPVVVTIAITNLAGRDIELHDADGQSWLGFEVTGSEGQPISLLSTEKAQPPLKIRSEEHTSELQSQSNLVCRLLLEKK